jgi:hypothetical protein
VGNKSSGRGSDGRTALGSGAAQISRKCQDGINHESAGAVVCADPEPDPIVVPQHKRSVHCLGSACCGLIDVWGLKSQFTRRPETTPNRRWQRFAGFSFLEIQVNLVGIGTGATSKSYSGGLACRKIQIDSGIKLAILDAGKLRNLAAPAEGSLPIKVTVPSAAGRYQPLSQPDLRPQTASHNGAILSLEGSAFVP